MKKHSLPLLLLLCLITALLTVPASAAEVAGGTCGDTLTWTLDDAGTLTVSGEGAIPAYGYYTDTPWYDHRGDIQSVVLAEGITGVGRHAFAFCGSLTQVTLPSTLESCHALAFEASGNLRRAYINDLGMWARLNFCWDCSDPVESGSPPWELYLNGRPVTEAVIPEGITHLGSSFRYIDSLTSVVIPEGVESIGTFAFAQCFNLTSVSLPSTLTRIHAAAFADTDIRRVDLADLKSWLNLTIDSNSGNPLLVSEQAITMTLKGQPITELVIPDDITTIRPDAFTWCIGIPSLVIPEGVTAIGERAFFISSLETIHLPSTLETIGDHAFYACDSVRSLYLSDITAWLNMTFEGSHSNPIGCTTVKNIYLNGQPLKSLVIPEGITAVPAGAFARCETLTRVVFPSTLASIGQEAFAYCYGLRAVAFLGEPPVFGKDAFYLITGDYYYPADSAAWAVLDIDAIDSWNEWYISVPTAITAQPVSAAASPDDVAVFTVKAQGDGLTYQWQFSTDGGLNWKNNAVKGSGYKTPALSVVADSAKSGRMYRCVITDLYGHSIASDAAVLTVAAPPVITAQPEDVTAPPGRSITFSVEADGDALTYQWQFSTDGGLNWKNNGVKGSGYKTATLSVATELFKSGRMYRCIITNRNGVVRYSDPAKLIVRTPLAINEQPRDTSAVSDQTVTFSVAAAGDDLKYQWQFSTDGGLNWKNNGVKGSGYKTATLSVLVKDFKYGRMYRCIITDKYQQHMESAAATLTKPQ